MSLIEKLKQRKLVQWALAYLAGAWVLLQVVGLASDSYAWPRLVMQLSFGVAALGFLIALVLAWYHGERGAQKVTGAELLILALLFVIGGGVLLHMGRPTPPQPVPARVAAPVTAAIPPKSIAVLPFENLSSDKSNGYFADGMQDLILTKLASIGDLKVISRTSTMKYGSHPEELKTIGQQLGVATILEGSVQKVGDQVLINVQLIDAQSDSHIWADSYTRTLKNVFSVEGEVAQKIADTLKARLSPAETRRLATTLSDDPAANDLYLQGDYFANRGRINVDTAAMKQAIAFYRQAIAKAPDFAQAHARLSLEESNLAWFGGGGRSTAELSADALAQAEQALKLAPDLADAHLALGMYEYWGKSDYAPALKAISAALALRPNDSLALIGKASVLRREGKFDEAIDVFQKALALDPRNTFVATEMGSTYMAVSRFAKAEQAYQRALALDPANVNARYFSALTMVLRSGDLTEALAQAQGDSPRLAVGRVGLLMLAREYEQALTLLQSIPDSPDTFNAGYIGPKSLHLATLYRLRGDPAKAQASYARALPQARAQYFAQAGSRVINQGFALTNVAQAKLGLGQTDSGLADTAKALTIAEHSDDHFSRATLLQNCAALYAQAGRADEAVPVLSTALETPGIGASYSPVMLWLDPDWDPIRTTPQFQALLKKYAADKPAHIPDGART